MRVFLVLYSEWDDANMQIITVICGVYKSYDSANKIAKTEAERNLRKVKIIPMELED